MHGYRRHCETVIKVSFNLRISFATIYIVIAKWLKNKIYVTYVIMQLIILPVKLLQQSTQAYIDIFQEKCHKHYIIKDAT